MPPSCRPSPFTEEGLFGAGFVSDEDRVSLQPLLFATPTSRGENTEARRAGEGGGQGGWRSGAEADRRCE